MTTPRSRLVVNQFHYHAAGADAITGQMRFIQASLKAIGIGGEVFAVEVKKGAGDVVALWDPERASKPNSLLLIHHSQGNPLLDELLSLPVKKGIVYHNITPPDFFAHDPLLAQTARLGREQLKEMSDQVDVVFADSAYNASELKGLGFRDIRQLPLFDARAFQTKKREPRRPELPPRVLFVGRLSPHKDQARLIETLYYLDRLRPGTELFLVGGGDPVYQSYLKDLARMLNISGQVHLPGTISAEARDLCYRSSQAFVCLSQHEGFCIPLVEAMAADLPIFSLPDTAIAETLDGAGVQLNTNDPAKIAAVIDAVLGDTKTVGEILAGQRRRLKSLERTQCAARIQEAFVGLRRLVIDAKPAVAPSRRRRSYAPSPATAGA
jgi:glycosyltransferase involved in cell wall biosynthesis